MSETMQALREEIRWRILMLLHEMYPVGSSEAVIWRRVVEQPVAMAATIVLRRELCYLEEKSLIFIEKGNSHGWFAQLTVYGVDVVECAVMVPPGIARPMHPTASPIGVKSL